MYADLVLTPWRNQFNQFFIYAVFLLSTAAVKQQDVASASTADIDQSICAGNKYILSLCYKQRDFSKTATADWPVFKDLCNRILYKFCTMSLQFFPTKTQSLLTLSSQYH